MLRMLFSPDYFLDCETTDQFLADIDDWEQFIKSVYSEYDLNMP